MPTFLLQLMVGAEAINGLDVRMCENREYQPQFNEPNEAIWAGTIPELQGTKENTKRNKLHEFYGNCWMEFRAVVRRLVFPC
jgi:hypothetical protein